MKRTRINPVSKKRQAQMVQRRHLVKDILTSRPNCEAQLEGCSRWSVDVHERLNRSQGGDILSTDPEAFMSLCRPCHSHITTHPKESYERGFSIHNWD